MKNYNILFQNWSQINKKNPELNYVLTINPV